MDHEGIVQIVINALSSKGIKLPVKVTDEKVAIMSYNVHGKEFYLSPTRMSEGAQSFNLDINDYVELVVCHEVGHYLFFQEESAIEILREYLELWEKVIAGNGDLQDYHNLKNVEEIMEIKAWEYGKEIVPSHLRNMFNLLNLLNLQRHLAMVIEHERL